MTATQAIADIYTPNSNLAYFRPSTLSWTLFSSPGAQNGDFVFLRRFFNTSGVYRFTITSGVMADPEAIGLYLGVTSVEPNTFSLADDVMSHATTVTFLNFTSRDFRLDFHANSYVYIVLYVIKESVSATITVSATSYFSTAVSGKSCDVLYDYCSVAPCSNNAPCVNLLGGFFCECPMGYAGERCETTCSHGGANYMCSPGLGQFKNGTACTSKFNNLAPRVLRWVDTQSCDECQYGSNYSCLPGMYKSGAVCNGTSFTDTQTCDSCGNGGFSYQCDSGQKKTGTNCTGQTFDTQTCMNCNPGFTDDYWCGVGFFRTGTLCTGNSRSNETDPQTCAPCGNGAANYSCPFGYYRTGLLCDGYGYSTNDTQTCLRCTSGCGVGGYIGGLLCDGLGDVDTQVCGTCGNYNGTAYDCGLGNKSGYFFLPTPTSISLLISHSRPALLTMCYNNRYPLFAP